MMRFLLSCLRWFGRILLLLIFSISSFYTWQLANRPPRTSLSPTELYDGITFERIVLDEPRPQFIQILTLNYAKDSVQFFTTPPDNSDEKLHLNARKVSQFAVEFDAQIAVNGNFYYPFKVGTPFTYYPKPGDPVTSDGLAIANGVRYAPPKEGYGVVCFRPKQVTIQHTDCPPDTEHALSGNAVPLQNGIIQTEITGNQFNAIPYGRVVIATDAPGERVWIVVIDNKQWGYSRGAQLGEVAELLQERGAAWALNLDGGGSTTLVFQENGNAIVQNSPVHTSILGRERPVANHLGIRVVNSDE